MSDTQPNVDERSFNLLMFTMKPSEREVIYAHFEKERTKAKKDLLAEVREKMPDVPNGSCKTCQLSHPKQVVKNDCIHLDWLRGYRAHILAAIKEIEEGL